MDFTQPVALMVMGLLGHVGDYDEARSIVERLLDTLPSGSYLVLDDGTDVVEKAAVEEGQGTYNESGAIPYHSPQPRADRRLLRRVGAGGARRGVGASLAARSRRIAR